MRPANKVAFNTSILYVRMLASIGISLYSTRVILDAMGTTDYGIFNLTAGIIAMLSFLNTAMATSTQRFLSYYQGKKDLLMQKAIFSNSMILHIIIGVLLVLLLELASLFLFNGFLVIPADRIQAAKLIYHYMSATVFFTVIAVPYRGSLTAHEDMVWIALVDFSQTLMKLGIAIFLLTSDRDRLVVYGMLTAVITIFSFFMYAIYSARRYPECSFSFNFKADRGLLKELGSFAGWNLFGSLCGVARNQGLGVVLNLFYGTVVNASYGLANQVSAQMNFLSSTLLRVLNPQIMKSEGLGDRDRMLRLSMMASKFGFFMLAIFAIPCIFEIDQILVLWLKDVPEGTGIFCILILLGILTNQLTVGIQSALQATGNITKYQVVVGTTLLLNLPVAYLLLLNGFQAHTVLVSYVCVELLGCILRLYFAKVLTGLSIRMYFDRVLLKEIGPVVLSVLTCFLIGQFVDFQFRFIITGVISSIVFCFGIYAFGLCADERKMLLKSFDGLKGRLRIYA